MSQVDKLRVYFVLQKDDDVEDDCSSDMRMVSQTIAKYGGYVEWMKPSDCISHSPQDKDVFVFDKFEGEAFDKLKKNSSKHVIIGTRCLLTCITSGRSIPSNPYPVFTEGMRDLWVTCTGFDQATKRQIQEKVQYMSGYYDNSLRSIITHVVAHNNITTKAIHAYKSNIKVMKLSWVEDVWQRSLVSNVNGKDDIFLKHVSPLFHNLHITTSGIPKKEKDGLKEVIEINGGHFMGTLEGNVTNIVLLTKPEGEKYRFAKSWGITCVTPLWVYDCIDATLILPFGDYVVDSNKPKSSTPNKENSADFSANFTGNLSVINPSTDQKHVTHLDETATTLSGRSEFQTPRTFQGDHLKTLNSRSMKSLYANVINNVLLKNLKDAGQFLDGLNIFLHGFNPEDSEKLKKILNQGGATRFNEMCESVTHVIAGKKDDVTLSGLAKFGAYILSIDWLVESMKLKTRASESKFLLMNNSQNPLEPPSPMSKRGAQLLSQGEAKNLQKTTGLDDQNENDKLSEIDELLCRYNASQPGEPLDQPYSTPATGTANLTISSAANKSETSRTSNLSTDEFFAGLTFFLSDDLSEEENKYLEDLIIERKGQIVGKRFLGVPDYAIVPVIGASLTEVAAKEVVNVYFVKDCCVEGYLLTPRYYHQPVACVKDATPLKYCVISVSNYVQGEREFMEMMIEALGGVAQSLLARKPKQGALKSTHLVCAEAQGQKYEGALRWGLPVVHHDWLLKCAALGIRVSEKPYLVGSSKLIETKSVETVQSSCGKTNTFDSESATSSKPPTGGSCSEKMVPNSQQLCFPSAAEVSAAPAFAKSTPVHNAITRIKNAETPTNACSPDPNRTITPTSPYGAFYGNGNPTPGTRKRIWKWMNQGADFPLDPPPKRLENEGESTPVAELISRHLEMMKRKPEDLPPDSPNSPNSPNPMPLKRLNLNEEDEDDQSRASVEYGLEKMRQIEEHLAKNGIKSPPTAVKKPSGVDGGQMVVVAESQPHTEVGWEDPVEKEIALANLKRAAENKTKAKVFMFSCIADQLEEAKKLVEKCGGVVSPVPYFDAEATHLIAGNLLRAEKLMASIAAGLWVLHPSYIDALKKVKSVHEVQEEDYEWGSPKQKFRLNLLPSNAKDFANSAHTWRVAIKNGEPPPFLDMKFLLHLSEPKYDSFERLLEAGGGKVVKGQPPHYRGVNADLCVYEYNNTEAINFASLAKQNIRCVALLFISDVLLRKKNAVENNLVPEFLQCWDTKWIGP